VPWPPRHRARGQGRPCWSGASTPARASANSWRRHQRQEFAEALAGDGPERPALEARHAGDQIRFLGWQDYPAALALAARSHLCVVPSICEEACSTTVLEALALGKPCLALARGGTPELASYQHYPGQLQLFDTMAQLVERMAVLLAQAPGAHRAAPRFGADAAVILSRLVDLYAE
jgi:hypothetical protein